jgi:hypothetical protein
MFKKEDLEKKSVEELVKIVLDVQKENGLTVKVNEDLSKKVETLEKKIKETPVVAESKSAVSDKSFKVGDKEFGFKKIRISHKNQLITAAEVLSSENLQKELVDIGSGMIYEKEK